MTKLNRLAQAHSPYLLQHADNPVDWYEWGTEALQRAQTENKPILLSIGYSACHWCHVMAHESFEDVKTASLMNHYFINIKVDREERPDLDKIYQQAHQLLTGRAGGWPLTIFLTPNDHIPFFSGTYFPLQTRYGIPAFSDVMQKINSIFKSQRNDINSQNSRLKNALAAIHQFDKAIEQITKEPLLHAQHQLEEMFDRQYGGFGTAPKFPQPMLLNFLMAEKGLADFSLRFSLQKMAQGGIYDHLSGGFYRYTVDAAWDIPHFEKMLYDNGQLLSIYADAYQKDPQPLFKKVLTGTAEWLLREMRSKEGGFFSSLNADSEGEEGKYYRWDKKEIKSLLSVDEYELISQHFNLLLPANFEGYWHLHIIEDLESIAKKTNQKIQKIKLLTDNAIEKLLNQRSKRTAPSRDDKILTAWNALVIKGLVKAGFVLKRNDFVDAALQAIDFLQEKLWTKQGLLASYKNGHAYLTGYLDDYAFLLDALLCVMQIHWRDKEFNFAKQLAGRLLNDYYDIQEGGFFFTTHHHEKLLQRIKPLMDEATPAGNALATSALQRLGSLTGDPNYIKAAEKTLQFAYSSIKKFPTAHVSFLAALKEYLQPSLQVILHGDQSQFDSWRDEFLRQNLTQATLFAIPASAKNLPFGFSKQEVKENEVAAYICSGLTCSPPAKNLPEFILQLKNSDANK